MKKDYLFIFLRYIFVLLVGLGGLKIFYLIFTPITFYLSYFILKLIGDAIIFNEIILFNGLAITLVESCIAGSAYYLLFILIFLTGKISALIRLKFLLFSYSFFLLFNLVRIVFLATIFYSSLFGFIHFIFWEFLSTLLIILIWFSGVKLLKIKSIPIYTDLKSVYKNPSKVNPKVRK